MTPPLNALKGSEDPPRPAWENALFEANTAEEIAAALAMRDKQQLAAPRPAKPKNRNPGRGRTV